jgi:hypothetical protein
MLLIDDVAEEKIRLVDVQSHLRPGFKDPSLPHRDICVVYKVGDYIGELKQPKWFSDFGFKSNLKPDDFTRGHGDFLDGARLIGKS